MNIKIELSVLAISKNIENPNSYLLILGEKNGLKKLPILIGSNEAQAIVVALENIKITRPLTHDLLVSFCTIQDIHISEVYINKFLDGVYYCLLIGKNKNDTFSLDCRVSDAIAIAVRVKCPVFIENDILIQGNPNIKMDQKKSENLHLETNNKISNSETTLAALNKDELKNKLSESLEQENYLYAALIRDELNKRK